MVLGDANILTIFIWMIINAIRCMVTDNTEISGH